MSGLTKKVKTLSNVYVPGSNINIGGLSDWTDTGLNVTLPQAGTYLVYYNITTTYSHSGTFDNHWVEGRIYNNTASAVVAGTRTYLIAIENLAPNGDYFPRTMQLQFVITVNAQTVLKLQAISHSLASGCIIDKDRTSYGYMSVQ